MPLKTLSHLKFCNNRPTYGKTQLFIYSKNDIRSEFYPANNCVAQKYEKINKGKK